MMSAKYSKLPTQEPEEYVVDFGPAFTFKDQEHENYFTYSKNEKMYKSAFTYAYKPENRDLEYSSK